MKDLIISKELMSEVLNYEVDTFLGINKNEIDYTCCRDENEGYIDLSINLYEFAFKCKEWALKKGFKISSSCNGFSISQYGVLLCSLFGKNNEIEAILKACNLILEQNK